MRRCPRRRKGAPAVADGTTVRLHQPAGGQAEQAVVEVVAPERVDKRRMCTVQSDVFSMAVVLWECLAGRRLFRGDEAIDTLQEVVSSHIPRLRLLGAQVPPALDDAIMRGLSRDLHVRYATAQEFAEAIAEGAGRTNIGTDADVARVVDAVFGPRLGIRHEQVRSIVGPDVANELFARTGIEPRPAPPPNEVIPQPMLYASIAPAAPSERYAFGNLNDSFTGASPLQKASLAMVAAIAGGVAIAIFALGALFFRLHTPTPDPVTTTPVSSAMTDQAPATRKVIVPLPFPASHVTFDDTERDLDPPANVASFDVDASTGLRHRLVAIGANGSRAEGFVKEVDGLATQEDGFATYGPAVAAATTTAAPAQTPATHRSHPKPKNKGTTTRHDGFTKLQ